jgi:hypothetical protein
MGYSKLRSKQQMRNRDQQFEEILKQRAERLGISTEETLAREDEKPRFIKAAEKKAAQLGVSVEEVLAQDLEMLRKVRYPGPDCLQAHEVEEYVRTGNLPDDIKLHVQECRLCEVLLAGSIPEKDRIEEFAAQIPSLLREIEEQASNPDAQPGGKVTRWRAAVAGLFGR